jgi:NAD(P)-dependent dehydrogenase (short-subunit alcohol dehydrogenase family)
MFNLDGKKIVVTGASSGLGSAAAIKLSHLDAKICLIGRDNQRLEKTLSLMKKNNHMVLSVDLCKFEEYNNFFEKIVNNIGKLNGLVHFAGIRKTLPLNVMKLDALKEILNINLLSFFELVKYFTKKNNVNETGASIVGISSVMSLRGAAALSGYGCSKAALDGAVRSLACELAGRNIRVNSIAPGFVKTPMNEDVMKTLPKEAIDKIIAAHPLGIGEPVDVANLVAFLLSDNTKWITGSTITIDGGFSIGS